MNFSLKEKYEISGIKLLYTLDCTWHFKRYILSGGISVNFLNKYRIVMKTKFPSVLRLLRALLIISPRRVGASNRMKEILMELIS